MASLGGTMSDMLSASTKGMNGHSGVRLHNMDVEEHGEKYFDFFGLPRELRDMVYAELLNDTRLDSNKVLGDRNFILWVSSAISTELLVLNRQFRDEYQALSKRHAILFLEDGRSSYSELRSGILDSLLESAPQLDVILRVTDGTDAFSPDDDLAYHAQWVPKLLSSRSLLRYFSITAFICVEHCEPALEERIVEGLLRLTGLVQCDMLRIGLGRNSPGSIILDKFTIRYKWTSKDPVLRRLSDSNVPPESLVEFKSSSTSTSFEAREGGIEEEVEESEECGTEG